MKRPFPLAALLLAIPLGLRAQIPSTRTVYNGIRAVSDQINSRLASGPLAWRFA